MLSLNRVACFTFLFAASPLICMAGRDASLFAADKHAFSMNAAPLFF